MRSAFTTTSPTNADGQGGFGKDSRIAVEKTHGSAAGSEAEPSFWALRAVGDEDARALGIEIRATSIKAAIIDTLTGAFIDGASTKIKEANPEEVEAGVRKMVDHFQWKGTVGCSITKAVARGLGCHSHSFSALDRDVGNMLKTMIPDSVVVTMVHTEAAGYSELAFGLEKGDLKEDDHLVMVVTIGAAMGSVVYLNGHRMRNTGLNSKYLNDFEPNLAALQAKYP
ncbi:hypothetical protein CYMTET_29111, partial [Cymbomonas tetramitiformis]